MNAKDYGHHFSGYPEAGGTQAAPRGLLTPLRRLREAGSHRAVPRFHESSRPLDSRVRGVHRLGDDPHGLRASHRQRFGRAHGLRARSPAAPVPRFERGGRRITVLPDGVENRPAKRKENR